MKSWLTILIDKAVWGARLPFVKLKALEARLVRALEAWAASWPDFPRHKPKERRKHGPGWISPKAMAAAIRAEIVPIALARGWIPVEQHRARKRGRRLGEFLFERSSPGRIENVGFDYQYGDKPEVWIMFSLQLNESSVGPTFWTGNCANYSDYRKPFWVQLMDWLRPPPEPLDSLASTLKKGLERFEIVEEFFRTGALHRDFNIYSPRVRWRRDGTVEVVT